VVRQPGGAADSACRRLGPRGAFSRPSARQRHVASLSHAPPGRDAMTMSSYRFARRSSLRAVGGAVGLKVMLRNLEASAAGTPPPPRFLAMYWPVGTVRYFFLPTPPS